MKKLLLSIMALFVIELAEIIMLLVFRLPAVYLPKAISALAQGLTKITQQVPIMQMAAYGSLRDTTLAVLVIGEFLFSAMLAWFFARVLVSPRFLSGFARRLYLWLGIAVCSVLPLGILCFLMAGEGILIAVIIVAALVFVAVGGLTFLYRKILFLESIGFERSSLFSTSGTVPEKP
jgi:hypothetical protein